MISIPNQYFINILFSFATVTIKKNNKQNNKQTKKQKKKNKKKKKNLCTK